ncbi:MAG: hypothetical protein SVK08_10660 [Halobacteriota archaeon]|nr:hypothetical protein [Halobacteriota archaeon]
MLGSIIMWMVLMGLVALPLFILIKIQNDFGKIRESIENTEVPMIGGLKENRIGKFKVSMDFLKECDMRELKYFFSYFIIIEATNHFSDRSIEYTAYSSLFDDIGYICTPEYDISYNRITKYKMEVTATRIN